MNKRLDKLHKRQVSRARNRVRVSEPDLRTPEQQKAAREASRAVAERRTDASPHYATRAANPAGRGATSAVKTDSGS
jgi:hypothetical protein